MQMAFGLVAIFSLNMLVYVSYRNFFNSIDDKIYTYLIFPLLLCFPGYVFFLVVYYFYFLAMPILYSYIIIMISLFFLAIFRCRNVLIKAFLCLFPILMVTGLILVIGFYFYQGDSIQVYASNRWINLPIDNWLPKILSDQAISGSIGNPMIGDWLASDRPPLASGIFMLYSLMSNNDILYQVYSTWLQVLILFPVIFLIQKYIHHRLYATITFVLYITSSAFLYNTVFVWPKLLASTFVFIFFLVLFYYDSLKLSAATVAIIAALSSALAMLSHGGSAFPLLVLSLLLLPFLFNRNWKFLMLFVVCTFATYFPWALFQKIEFPPGDRLLKWHLAGLIEVSQLDLLSALKFSYQSVEFRDIYERIVVNLSQNFYGGINLLQDVLSLNFEKLKINSFYYTSYSMFVFFPLFVIPLYLFFSILKNEYHKNILIYLFLVLTSYLLWSALMYIPSSTVIHQGSLFPWSSLFLLSCFMWYGLNKKLYFSLAVVQMFIFIFSFLFEDYENIDNSEVLLYYIIISLLLMIVSLVSYFMLFPKQEGMDSFKVKIN